MGALWTPPYWGWQGGIYMFHPGYWGPHVGYYGGVNYGFGYMGIGFVGGEWRGHDFAYNTAVVHVNETIIHTTYINRTIVEQNTIVNDRHVAFSGGPGGIQHQPSPQERVAMHEAHVAPTSFQQQHVQAASANRASYFNANHGHPQTLAVARPLAVENHPAPAARPNAFNGNAGQRGNNNAAPNRPPAAAPNRPAPQQQSHPQPNYRPAPESRPAPEPRQESRPAPAEKAPREKPEKEPKRR
jgi:hypothetical protein